MKTPTADVDYIMEHETEGARIRNKTDLEATRMQLVEAGLKSGMSGLDVGCGSGAVTVEMARMAFPSVITGFDASTDRIGEGVELAGKRGVSNITFEEGNLYELPFPDNSFDFVWSRFVLEYLKEPVAAIQEMMRVVKPGGTVACGDLDGNCVFHYPIDQRLEDGLKKVMKILASTGFDPFVGRKLYHYFRTVGFPQTRVFAMPHHLIAGTPSVRDRNNWHDKVDTIAANLKGHVDDDLDLVYIADAVKDLIDRPDTFTYSTLIFVVGTK